MSDVLQPSSATSASISTSEQPEPVRRATNGATSEQPAGIPTDITWEEYLAWDFEESQAEWVDGEVVIMPPVRADHQFATGFVYRLICDLVEQHGLGFVLQPPMRMGLSSRPREREPDVLFVTAEHADRIKEALVDGPADLAVEVV